MAHPYMSQKDLPNYGAVNVVPASPLPAYYVTPAPPPRRGYTFLKTLVVALALLEAGRLGYQWHQREWHRRHGHVHVPGWDIDIDMRGIDHGAEGCAVWDHYDPDHPSLNVDDQASGNDYKHLDNRDKFSFSIPTSSERYHFVSWGPIDKSQFEVIPVESDKEQIVVEVDIVKDSRNSARVCALPSTGESGAYGVGIYSPRHHDPYPVRDWPAFGIKVFIPVSSDGSQRQLNALETRLGQFEHVFPDLSETINFSKLRLSAANVPMTFGSVVANWVKVSNANGPIEGTFTSATDLALVNANSKVIGNLTLTQAGNIFVGNANSDVDLVVHLKSGDFHPRPDYYITLENAKAPIGITIAEQPVGSGFFLKASNAASSVRAHLHAAYEGRFRLSDVMRVPSVEVTNHKDPAGRGRERYLQFEKTGWTTTGRVEWGSPDDAAEHAPGEVNISTVMAPIELFFD